MSHDLFVDGAAIAYRLFDVGYAIQLDRAASALPPAETSRARPARAEAQALQIQNPPLALELSVERLHVREHECAAQLSARLYDFGVCAMQLRVDAPPGLSWHEYAQFGTAVDVGVDLTQLFVARRDDLLQRIGDAVVRPMLAPVTEDYVVFRIGALRDATGATVPPQSLTDEHLVPLLLGESRRLSEVARRELLQHRFSYYADDLAVLTWDNALVVEHDPLDRDIEYVLEFANAQLLELRVYDALLDAELPALYDRVQTTRAGRPLFTGPFGQLLGVLQARLADITETVERVENSLKVTDDVYLARIYMTALELFRGQAWRRGVDRKLGILRDTYGMLNSEAQATRAQALEIAIVVLIVAELLVALVHA